MNEHDNEISNKEIKMDNSNSSKVTMKKIDLIKRKSSALRFHMDTDNMDMDDDRR